MGKFLLFALAAFLLWKLLAGDFKQKAKKKKEEPRHEAAAGAAKRDMVKDPVCGAFVSTSTPERYVGPDGAMRHFCSQECRTAYVNQIEARGSSPTRKE